MSIAAAYMVPHPPMIVPQVGRGSEAQIAETTRSYEQVAEEIAAIRPESIIITSPHTVMYSDYFHISPGRRAKGSFSDFRAPSVRFDETLDEELTDRICALCAEKGFPAGTMGEKSRALDHGVMVPLFFIRKRYDGAKIVRIGLSGLPLTEHYRLGQIIREAVERTGRHAVFIASGDLSHKLQSYGPYGFAPEGPEYDRRIMDVCGRAAFGELFDFEESFCEKAAECGHRSFVIMAGALDGIAVRAEALSHQDVTGVGYGICSFHPGEADAGRHFLDQYLAKLDLELEERKRHEDAYVRLARAAVEAYVRESRRLRVPGDLDEILGTGASGERPEALLKEKAGVFVSIHKHGKLRGCIGTIQPVTGCIAQEIARNAVSASTEDPRFDPVSEDELRWLEINVDVLGSPEPVSSEAELDARRYGVIVTSGYKRGLLLPDLEGVDTVQQQISIAKQKAGIRKGEPVRLERFTVTRHT